MTRETKVERLAREAQARLVEEEALKASYPERLMAALERATNLNYEILVRHGAFVLSDNDAPHDGTISIAPTALAREEALRELDWKLGIKEEAEREARRRDEIRKAALCKLSAEEKDILGL